MSRESNLSIFQETNEPPARDGVTLRHDHLTFRGNQGRGRHAWLRLTPAYSVHLVEALVEQEQTAALVLDPFCGTGTTALVCAQHGLECHTVDINPFLVWLARAKCAPYRQETMLEGRDALTRCLSEIDPSGRYWTPSIQEISKWWEAPVLGSLACVNSRLDAAALSEPASNLLRVAFCRVAIETAAVSFGHQSMSFKKRKGGDLILEEDPVARVRSRFLRAFEEIARSAIEPLHHTDVRAILGDSRSLDSVLDGARYSTVITSPPYPNRMSYIREVRPYMYWLRFLESGRQAGELDWASIGGTWGCATSNLLKWTADSSTPIPFDEFDGVVARIRERSAVLAQYVHKYFEDTVRHVASLRRVLKPGARVFYVVGNSKFYDVMLATHEMYAAIFAAQGFDQVAVRTIRKRTSKKELFEYVVSARLP